MSSNRTLAAVTLAVASALAGCGYAMVGGEATAINVAVPLFENRTFEPFIEARITERVKSRLAATGPWRLVNRPGRAHLVIRGAVSGFGTSPVSFDAAHHALEQRVTVTAEVAAVKAGSPEVPVWQGALSGSADYTELGDSLDTRAAKNRAIEEAGDALAQDLIARLTSATAGTRGTEILGRVPAAAPEGATP